jgi:hypothetical protein
MYKLIVLSSLLDTSEDWLRWGDNSLQKSLNNKVKQTGSRPCFADENLNRDWVQDYRFEVDPKVRTDLMAV